jgi:hypothetical protein
MNPSEFAGLDLCAGVVRGARSFAVDDDGNLTGIVYKQIWSQGENLAICRKGETFIPLIFIAADGTAVRLTAPPDTRYQVFPDSMATCPHGFYAYYDGSHDFRTGDKYVAGVIEGYGETVIGTRGFRCMKARIVALQPADARGLEAVVNNYPDIPLFDTFAGMLAEFPPDIPERKAP